MNCQNCGAPMHFDHEKICFSCDYCTSIYFPDESEDGIRQTDEQTTLDCPVCKIPLVHAYIGKIQVSFCGKCRGLLIQQPDFLLVVQYARSRKSQPEIIPPPVRMAEVERQVYCPSCCHKMDTHPYGGPGNVVIDNCPRCKVNWLDHDELHRITSAPDRAGADWGQPEEYEWLFGINKKPDKGR